MIFADISAIFNFADISAIIIILISRKVKVNVMDVVTIVGTRDVNFKDRKTGEIISGVSLYYTQQVEGVHGLVADKLFLSSDRLNMIGVLPNINDVVCVDYDRYGKPVGFRPYK